MNTVPTPHGDDLRARNNACNPRPPRQQDELNLASDARTAASEPESPECPPWCTNASDDHDVDDVDDVDGSKYHPGPSFGLLRLAGVTRSDGSVRSLSWMIEADGDGRPAEMRDLSAEAQAAAGWLESLGADVVSTATMGTCPSWCGREPGHDASDTVGRVHWPTPFGRFGVEVAYDDAGRLDSPTEPPWTCEPPPSQLFGNTPSELAGGIREYATSLLLAAEWLEGQS